MKSTLKRESKALEIVEIDTFVVSGCFVLGFSWFSSGGIFLIWTARKSNPRQRVDTSYNQGNITLQIPQ